MPKTTFHNVVFTCEMIITQEDRETKSLDELLREAIIANRWVNATNPCVIHSREEEV